MLLIITIQTKNFYVHSYNEGYYSIQTTHTFWRRNNITRPTRTEVLNNNMIGKGRLRYIKVSCKQFQVENNELKRQGSVIFSVRVTAIFDFGRPKPYLLSMLFIDFWCCLFCILGTWPRFILQCIPLYLIFYLSRRLSQFNN